MITVNSLNQAYGGTQILWNLSMTIEAGVCTCIMGRNGVGKTTLLQCLMGLLPTTSGEICYRGENITDKPVIYRARNAIAYVPQGRDIFPTLTVEENLRIGLSCRKDKSKKIPDSIFELFPVLKNMLNRQGGDLSGGQQQQLAIARALVIDPQVLILDEPNEGIAPNIVKAIGDVLLYLNDQQDMTIILVEQKLNFARRVGQYFHLMEKGQVVSSGNMPDLSDQLIQQHLAV